MSQMERGCTPLVPKTRVIEVQMNVQKQFSITAPP
jgi:hypothetical protein